ncbi:MAG: metalloregulator ArsR/SmtB family transcription factor [Pseudomonadota bacterium]
MPVSDWEILEAIKRSSPVTTAALRERLGITQAGMRQRLTALEATGLLRQSRTVTGVGRPNATWSLTAAGHARFPDGHAEVTVSLIDDLTSLFGPDALERLLERREAEQKTRYAAALKGAKTLEERLERLTALRSAEGYMASLQQEAQGVFLLSEHHCPICAAATACQGFCRSELDLFRQLLEPVARVERSQHLLSGDQRCVYRIEAKECD